MSPSGLKTSILTRYASSSIVSLEEALQAPVAVSNALKRDSNTKLMVSILTIQFRFGLKFNSTLNSRLEFPLKSSIRSSIPMQVPEVASVDIPVTKQTRRDRIEGSRRMTHYGTLYPDMEQRLKPFPKQALLGAAESMHRTRGIPWPDRICYRCRQPLICHYCKHFPDFPRGFCSLLTNVVMPNLNRNENVHKEIVAQEPLVPAVPAAAQYPFAPLLPNGTNHEGIDNIIVWDDDPLDFWYGTA
jgi:hypothetical protein